MRNGGRQPIRENAGTKARRLLTEGRVDVRYRQGHDLRAVIRGDSGEEYEAGHVAGSWYCGCPAFGRCSHVMALQLIAVVVRPGQNMGDGGAGAYERP